MISRHLESQKTHPHELNPAAQEFKPNNYVSSLEERVCAYLNRHHFVNAPPWNNPTQLRYFLERQEENYQFKLSANPSKAQIPNDVAHQIATFVFWQGGDVKNYNVFITSDFLSLKAAVQRFLNKV